jgi:serine protease Do
MATLAAAPPALAQQPAVRFADPLTLVGPGASIGVRVRDLNSDDVKDARLETSTGVYIQEVEKGTPADRAGLKSGDIVTDFDGERVRSVQAFRRLVAETPPQRTVKTTIVRNGSRKTLEVTPEPTSKRLTQDFAQLPRDFPRLRIQPRPPGNLLGPETRRFELGPPQRRLGVTLNTLEGQMAEFFGVSGGALVSSVDGNSAGARAGLKAGDVITAVNGHSVRQPSEVAQEIRDAKPGSQVTLKIVRDKKEVTLDVTLPTAQNIPLPGAPVGDSVRLHV